MAISVQQVARTNFKAADPDNLSEVEDMRIGMGDGDASGKELESKFLYARQFPNRAVRDIANASQSP